MNKSLKILSMMEYTDKEIKVMKISDELYDEFSEFSKSLRSQGIKILVDMDKVLEYVDSKEWDDLTKVMYVKFAGLYDTPLTKLKEFGKKYSWYYPVLKKGDLVTYPNQLGGVFTYKVTDIKGDKYILVGTEQEWKSASGTLELNKEQMLNAKDVYTGKPVNI